MFRTSCLTRFKTRFLIRFRIRRREKREAILLKPSVSSVSKPPELQSKIQEMRFLVWLGMRFRGDRCVPDSANQSEFALESSPQTRTVTNRARLIRRDYDDD